MIQEAHTLEQSYNYVPSKDYPEHLNTPTASMSILPLAVWHLNTSWFWNRPQPMEVDAKSQETQHRFPIVVNHQQQNRGWPGSKSPNRQFNKSPHWSNSQSSRPQHPYDKNKSHQPQSQSLNRNNNNNRYCNKLHVWLKAMTPPKFCLATNSKNLSPPSPKEQYKVQSKPNFLRY